MSDLSKHWGQTRRASVGVDIFRQAVDPGKFVKITSKLKKAGDQQSYDLMRDIQRHFMDKFDMDSGEESAWYRLLNMVRSGAQWDESLLRNNVFKIANSLKMKLPSAMFASDLSAQWGKTVREATIDPMLLKRFQRIRMKLDVSDGGERLFEALVLSGNFGSEPGPDFDIRKVTKQLNAVDVQVKRYLEGLVKRVILQPLDGAEYEVDGTQSKETDGTVEYRSDRSRRDPGITDDAYVTVDVTCPEVVYGKDSISFNARGVLRVVTKVLKKFGYILNRRYLEDDFLGAYDWMLDEIIQQYDGEEVAGNEGEIYDLVSDNTDLSVDSDVDLDLDVDAGCSSSEFGMIGFDEIEIDGWEVTVPRSVSFGVDPYAEI